MIPRVDVIRCEDATWLLMNSPDHISDYIRSNGRWGALEAKICNMFLHGLQQSVVIDAGANIGGFTVPTAKELMKQGGILFGFEPQRVVFQQLCANVFVNQLDNVYLHNVALGEQSSVIEIPELNFMLSRNVGGFSIDKGIRMEVDKMALQGKTFVNTYSESGLTFSVPQLPLDAFGIFSDVAFIKVDVEGYELEVFRGSVSTLKYNRYPPVMFELWDNDLSLIHISEPTRPY